MFALRHTNNGFSLHVSSSRLQHLYCNNVFFLLILHNLQLSGRLSSLLGKARGTGAVSWRFRV